MADNLIIAVGEFDSVRYCLPPSTPIIELEGATAVPGFIDTHNHMLWTAAQSQRLDISSCTSIREIQDAIAAYASENSRQPWIVCGEGWHVANLDERRYPTRGELDAVCPDRPVYLPRVAHAAVVNSRALEAAGISRNTPDPAGGRIERDDQGEPNGLLLEPPAFNLVAACVPKMDRDLCRNALRDVQSSYHSVGITGVIEPGLTAEEVAVYRDLWRYGELTVRTLAMPLVQGSEEVGPALRSLSENGLQMGLGDTLLRIGGLKLFVDGGASLGTALIRASDDEQPCNCGIQVTPTAHFEEVAAFCAEHRWSLGVHAVGGAAIDLALDVFERVDRSHPIRDLRFTLIHAYLWPTSDNVRKAKALGVVVATQPSMQFAFGNLLAQRYGYDRIADATPIQSWLKGGVIVGGGSDSPFTPYSPILGMWQARTRHIDGHAQPLGCNEAISSTDALALYTSSAAYVAFCEHERGVLQAGMLADWVALSADPIACDAESFRHAEVLATFVDGTCVHDTGALRIRH